MFRHFPFHLSPAHNFSLSKRTFNRSLSRLLGNLSFPILNLSTNVVLIHQSPTFQFQHSFANLTVSFFFEHHRRHTRYYGGYHSNHRVVNWLWDVLEKEFNEEEKSRFLKVPYAIRICPILRLYLPAFDALLLNCRYFNFVEASTGQCCVA